MERLLEKKNLGIPVIILTLAAYFIGYYLTIDFSGLLVAVLFAVVVFSLDFDDKVKTAVKQSYIIGFLFNILYLGFDLLYQLYDLVSVPGYILSVLQVILNNIHRVGLILVHMAVIVVYFLFVLGTIINKEIKFGFLSNLLGEGNPKAKPQYQQPQQPMYQQPIPPMPQQMYQQPMRQPVQQPMQQNGQPSEKPQGPICNKCGAVNQADAQFCISCGNKL